MHRRPLNELLLYRYRYVIAYSLLALLTVGLLLLNIQSTPPGLSQREQNSVLASSRIVFGFHFDTLGKDVLHFLQTTNAVDLPYHLLQKGSLHVFGLSPLGVRLPSILLAIVTIFMLLGVMRFWLRTNAAVAASLLLTTSSWFISIGRLGTPDIMVIFWAALIALLATLISQESPRRHLWKASGVLAVGLSLYTPYTVYLFAAAIIASVTQPHLRYLVRYTGQAGITIGIFFLLILLVPLGFTILGSPGTVWQLLAVPQALPEPLLFAKDLSAALGNLLNPLRAAFTEVPQPLIAISTAGLAFIGLVRLVADWHSVRSQVVLLWVALLAPLVGLDASHNLVVLFVPIMLLSAIGVQALIQYWYTLFPFNPYARVFGLLPLGLLMFSLVQFNYNRYFFGLPYASTTASQYSPDAFLFTETISAKINRDQHIVAIVPEANTEAYALDQSIAKKLTITSAAQFAPIAGATVTRVIVAESELGRLSPQQQALLPTAKIQLIVNDRKDSGLRFRIYSSL